MNDILNYLLFLKNTILCIFLLSFSLPVFGSDSTNAQKEKNVYKYTYDGNDFNLTFDDYRMIYLSLPSDQYIMRMRSEGDVDVYFMPKDKNLLKGNVFIRQCETAIITTTSDSSVARSPVCFSGIIFKNRIELPQYDDNYTKNKNGNDEYGGKKKNLKKRIIYKYYIDTITEQMIELKGVSHEVHDKIKRISKENDLKRISVCGYYNVLNDCPYLEVHWVSLEESFEKILKRKEMLKKGPYGIW